MKFFENEKTVFYGNDSQRCVTCYNRLIATLCNFENIQYEEWLKSVEDTKEYLQIPLLYKNPDKDQLTLNFDWRIKETIKEGELMKRLVMNVPNVVNQLIYDKKDLDCAYYTLKNFIVELENVKEKVPNILRNIVKPLFKVIEYFN